MIWILMLLVVVSLVLVTSYAAYLYTFRRDLNRQALELEVPEAHYRQKAIRKIESLMNTPFEEVRITSFDGLSLYGRYYHTSDCAPLGIVFHGYRSNYCRDGNGAYHMLSSLGYNIIMVDQRAHGRSDGTVISFGINERIDCLNWVEYAKKRFGDDIKIVLVGVSMGAATVMMASDIVPPQNVRAIVADCGYSSPKEIICHVAKRMKLPPVLSYPMVWLGARLFGKIRLGEADALRSLSKTTIPVLFIHGESDGFVPCEMSRRCHKTCKGQKDIFTVAVATHGVSYYEDTQGYTKKVEQFLGRFV